MYRHYFIFYFAPKTTFLSFSPMTEILNPTETSYAGAKCCCRTQLFMTSKQKQKRRTTDE